jgi:hypothetical protein
VDLGAGVWLVRAAARAAGEGGIACGIIAARRPH